MNFIEKHERIYKELASIKKQIDRLEGDKSQLEETYLREVQHEWENNSTLQPIRELLAIQVPKRKDIGRVWHQITKGMGKMQSKQISCEDLHLIICVSTRGIGWGYPWSRAGKYKNMSIGSISWVVKNEEKIRPYIRKTHRARFGELIKELRKVDFKSLAATSRTPQIPIFFKCAIKGKEYTYHTLSQEGIRGDSFNHFIKFNNTTDLIHVLRNIEVIIPKVEELKKSIQESEIIKFFKILKMLAIPQEIVDSL